MSSVPSTSTKKHWTAGLTDPQIQIEIRKRNREEDEAETMLFPKKKTVIEWAKKVKEETGSDDGALSEVPDVQEAGKDGEEVEQEQEQENGDDNGDGNGNENADDNGEENGDGNEGNDNGNGDGNDDGDNQEQEEGDGDNQEQDENDNDNQEEEEEEEEEEDDDEPALRQCRGMTLPRTKRKRTRGNKYSTVTEPSRQCRNWTHDASRLCHVHR